MTPVRRLILTTLLLMMGACDMSTTPTNDTGPRLVRDGQAELDLSRRPSREELGVLPERDAAIYQDQVGDPGITTKVQLPGGREIVVTAYSIAVRTDGPDGPPVQVILNVNSPSSDTARSAVAQQADALALDVARLDQVFPPGAPAVSGGFVSQRDGTGMLTELQVLPSADGSIALNYLFSWPQPSRE